MLILAVDENFSNDIVRGLGLEGKRDTGGAG